MAVIALLFFENYYMPAFKHMPNGLHLDYRNLK